jgi:hypothetical protein
VLFRRDRTFERIRLSSPVEGTTIRLFKQATSEEAEAARGKARETLAYWCKHVRVEVRLDGEVVSGAMDLEGLCKVEPRGGGHGAGDGAGARGARRCAATTTAG